MTKRSIADLGPKSEKEEKHPSRESDTNHHFRSTRTFSDSSLNGDAKKAKCKGAASSTKSSVAEKKKKRKTSNRKRNSSASSSLPTATTHKKTSTTLTILQPPRSRQDGIPSVDTGNQEHHRDKQIPCPDLTAPVPGGAVAKKALKKKRATELSAKSPSTFIQDTAPNATTPERKNSGSDLRTSPSCEEGKKKPSAFTCLTKTLSSEFPDASQFYRDHFLPGSNRLLHSLRSQDRQRFWNTFPNPQSSPVKASRGSSPTLCPVNSVSAPSTPTDLLNIGQRNEEEKPCLSLGAVASCKSFNGLTRADLASFSRGAGEDQHRTFTPASLAASFHDKELFKDALNWNSLAKNNKDGKSNHQPASNQIAGSFLQYYSGHSSTPRVGSSYLLNFMLPGSQANRARTSPASTRPVLNSSSFHGGPLESLQLMSENQQRAQRQQSQFVNGQRRQRKYLERQKLKMLKPLSVNENQNNIAKTYDISTSEFSAAILPSPGTMSCRFTHDISFDEGTRYRSADFLRGVKSKDTAARGQFGSNVNGLGHHISPVVSVRDGDTSCAPGLSRHEGKLRHGSNSNINLKESVPLSLIRMEDRCELPPAASSSPPVPSTAIAATMTPFVPSMTSFVPSPSLPQRNAPASTTAILGSSNVAFRFHKEKQNWNHRLGDLSISGGGYSNPSPISPNSKQDIDDSINPINVTSAIQRNLQTRERASTVANSRSRLSMRYSSKVDDSSYADPCLSALPSFQQRLMDLSILESETVKYERNRKLRRKKNLDKDS